MVWFNVDDTLAFHPKAIQAGNAALGLWVRAGSWSAQTLSDGFVPRQIARSLGTVGQCKALVVAGLWLEVDGGYRFHEWDQRQQTKEDVEARREMERRRKADQRKRSRVPTGQTPDSQRDDQRDSQRESSPESREESAPESGRESADPSPSLPFPSSFSGPVEGGSYVSNARENDPPPPKHHPKHPDRWDPDCTDCTTLIDEQIDWQADQFADARPPSPYCDDHPGGTTDPCHACGHRRHDRKVFDATFARLQAAKRTNEMHRAAEDRARAIANCPMCDADGYAGGRVCDHDPESAARAARRIAEIREDLARQKAARHQPSPEPAEPVSVPTGRSEPTSPPDDRTQERTVV